MANPNYEQGQWSDPETRVDDVPPCQQGNPAFTLDDVATSKAPRQPGTFGLYETTSADEQAEPCDCSVPTENYPYLESTFEMVRRIAPLVLAHSSRYSVPPVAVAGAIADEYNTRTRSKGVLGWFQDDILLNFIPSSVIELDAEIGFHAKLFDATKNDIGLGVIKPETGQKIYDKNPNAFKGKGWDHKRIEEYLRSAEGTVQVTALYIQKAQVLLADQLQGLADGDKEAILVTYYLQGPRYAMSHQGSVTGGFNGLIKAGEGCRVCLQRDRFLKILTLD